MNPSRVLALEYVISLTISSWQAIKSGYAPFPQVVTRTSIAFGILGITGIAIPTLAATLGTGFLLAQLLKAMGVNVKFPAVIDPYKTPLLKGDKSNVNTYIVVNPNAPNAHT